jgi:hypothetical protein
MDRFSRGTGQWRFALGLRKHKHGVGKEKFGVLKWTCGLEEKLVNYWDMVVWTDDRCEFRICER